ncbi:MAG TPA: chromosome segregation protein SMC [Firmicutes bacterium]|nr:chromosome segregation protein SMC [Bacillota bacterium]
MYLKQLEIHGFKSFGEKTKLEFDRGITAIVGPNGSGKSNIADGLRWVLGEQSARSLRGDTMQDIIFAGSSGKGPLGMASVSLTLGDCKGCLNLEYDEVTVTRRVYRSGESEYLINKSPCRLRDIRDLFLDTGLGREGYWLIGQGQIDAVLSSRPEERRLIIEEAAGISKYRARKMEAVKKLADTETNLVRLNDIIVELARQLEPLEKMAVRARKYLQLMREYQQLGQALGALEWSQLTKERQERLAEEGQTLAKIAAIDEELRQVEKAAAALRLESKELEQLAATQQELRAKTIQDMGEVRRRQDALAERVKYSEAEGRRLAEELAELERRRQEVRRDLADCLWRLRALRKQKSDEAARLNHWDASFIEREKQREKLLEETERVKAALEHTRQKRAEIHGEVEVGESRRALWQEQHSVLSRRLEEIQRQLRAISTHIAAEEAALAEARNALAAKAAFFQDCVKLQQDLESRLKAQEEVVRSWEDKLQLLSSRHQALADMEKDYTGYAQGVKAVMRARDRFPGICGVVTELIRVPKQLETAVEVALGGGLQNIVTETDREAREAVAFLKERKAGRATFLPLSGLRPHSFSKQDLQRLEQDGVVGVASQLVEYDPKYRSAVEYLLGRVVITRDLDSAVALSRNWRNFSRIVTLDGDLVTPGGAITGGSLPQSERSGLLQRRQEVARLASALQECRERLQREKQLATALAKEREQAGARTKEAADQVQQLELRVQELEKSVMLNKSEVAHWEREADQVQTEMEEMAKRIAEEAAARQDRLAAAERLDGEALVQEKKLSALQAQIADLERERVSAQESYTAAKVNLAALNSQIQADEKAAAGCRSELLKIEQRTEQIAAALENLIRERSESLKEQKRLETQYSQLKEKLKEIEEQLAENGSQRQAVENTLREKEEAQKSKQAQRAVLQQELADVRRWLDKIALKKAQLAEAMAEEYGLTMDALDEMPAPVGDAAEMRRKLQLVKEQIRDLGPVDTGAIQQYEEMAERCQYLRRQQQDLLEAGRQLKQVIAEMDAVCSARFKETFADVQKEFQAVFAKLFGGGSAELVFLEAEQLEDAGVDISAKPPGKKLQNISLLSGGERALTAISLLFALLRVKPSPFCVLDEIDASLDESNLERFTQLLREFAADTQFIVITHRPATMEAADRLYGVTMNRAHISQLVSVRLDEAAAVVENSGTESQLV